jgi:integrase
LAGYCRFVRSNLCTRHILNRLTPRGHDDWPDKSEKMRQLYVEAGIEGKRTHEWRDTLAIEVLEGGGSLENVQLLLGHKSRKTTEKYYVALTKKRMEKAIDARRRTWDADTITLAAAVAAPPRGDAESNNDSEVP